MSYYNNSSSITVQNLSKYFNTNFNIELLNQQQYESITFENLEFDSFTIDKQTIDKNIYFKNVIINKLIINKSTFNVKFYINQENEENKNKPALDIKSISIKYTDFKDNFKLHNCNIKNIEIYQCNFYKSADFYKSQFGLEPENIKFSRLNFEGLVLLSDTLFHEFTIFEHVTIKGFCHFRNAEFKNGLDLTYVNFEKTVNFFGVKGLETKESIKNTSQETYRLIKHNLKKLDNTIEANKFHVLELKKYGENLNASLKSENTSIQDKVQARMDLIVLFLQKHISDYSQNWLIVLFFIVSIGCFTNVLLDPNKFNVCIGILICIAIVLKIVMHSDKIKGIHFIIGIILIIIFDYIISDFSMFKYMYILTEAKYFGCSKNSSILILLNKSALSYLYYQFITSIRRNTR